MNEIATKNSQVQQEVDSMVNNAEKIFKELEALEVRLSSVLSEQHAQPEMSKREGFTPAQTMLVPLAGILKAHNDQLLRMRDKLEELRNRIEL